MKRFFSTLISMSAGALFLAAVAVLAQEPPTTASGQPEAPQEMTAPALQQKPPEPEQLTLVSAEMCEAIDRFQPVNQAVVFSISLGRVLCFTAFDPVPEETHVFHRWYKRDRLIADTKLVLKPPKWSTFSSMQLREADKGPWRVEVVLGDGTIVKTLRLSISD